MGFSLTAQKSSRGILATSTRFVEGFVSRDVATDSALCACRRSQLCPLAKQAGKDLSSMSLMNLIEHFD